MTKEDKQTFWILFILIFMASILACSIMLTIKVNSKEYEYYKDGKFGRSNNCYVTEKQSCLCVIDGGFKPVDSFYEID